MKPSCITILVLASLLMACTSGKSTPFAGSSGVSSTTVLSKERAQTAISDFARRNGSGTITVLGIQDQGNEARADLSFSGFQWTGKSPYNGAPVQKNHSGPGAALFSRYTDGRWVLKKVETSAGWDSTWWDNLNAEVR